MNLLGSNVPPRMPTSAGFGGGMPPPPPPPGLAGLPMQPNSFSASQPNLFGMAAQSVQRQMMPASNISDMAMDLLGMEE